MNIEITNQVEKRLFNRPLPVELNKISCLVSIQRGPISKLILPSYLVLHIMDLTLHPEASQFRQSERVRFLPIRKGPSQFRRVIYLPIWKVPIFSKTEGSQFCQSGRVLILAIRKGNIFANPEGSHCCQSGRVLTWPIRKGPSFNNLEGSELCQLGRIPFLPTFQSI